VGDGSPLYFGGNHGRMDLYSLLGLVGFSASWKQNGDFCWDEFFKLGCEWWSMELAQNNIFLVGVVGRSVLSV